MKEMRDFVLIILGYIGVAAVAGLWCLLYAFLIQKTGFLFATLAMFLGTYCLKEFIKKELFTETSDKSPGRQH